MNILGGKELVVLAEEISGEKSINYENIISIMEDAISSGVQKKYGNNCIIRTKIDKNNGDIKIFRCRRVVENVLNNSKEISLDEVQNIDSNIKLDDLYEEEFYLGELSRSESAVIRNYIFQKIREIESEREYDEYKNRVGEVVTANVVAIESRKIILQIGRASRAVMHNSDRIPGQILAIGQTIKASIKKVVNNQSEYQIFLSRADVGFLRGLLKMEVPEIYDGKIEIKNIARRPGIKSKVAIFTPDLGLDAVGACVGIRGGRINSISDELGGEKIDIILWSDNLAQFVINALSPANITKIVIDQATKKIQAILPEDQVNLAIGKRGQNVSLAAKLTNCEIDIITEEEESKRHSQKLAEVTALLQEKLEIDEITAQLLFTENLDSIEEISSLSLEDLIKIDGISEEKANHILEKASEISEQHIEEIIEKLEKLGVEQALLDLLCDIPPEYILKLAVYGVKTIEDASVTTLEEFRGILPTHLVSDDEILDIINQANEA